MKKRKYICKIPVGASCLHCVHDGWGEKRDGVLHCLVYPNCAYRWDGSSEEVGTRVYAPRKNGWSIG